MPRKKKLQQEIAEAIHAAPPLPAGVVEQLVTGPMTAGQLEGMFRQLKKAVVERALGAELSHHLGLERGQARAGARRNHRNRNRGQSTVSRPHPDSGLAPPGS